MNPSLQMLEFAHLILIEATLPEMGTGLLVMHPAIRHDDNTTQIAMVAISLTTGFHTKLVNAQIDPSLV